MSTSLVNEIASRLKSARKAAGYKSAKDFAIKQNIPVSTYSQHETGKRSINAELIIGYSSELQINPSWLLTGIDEPHVVDLDIHTTRGQNKLSSFSDKIEQSDKYRFVDFGLLKKVLLAIAPLLNDVSINLSYQELIDYCLEVYGIVSTLTISFSEKEKIINLTISSLKRGAVNDVKKLGTSTL
ncbi:MAG TPA: helix-turn-helix transcriptional regulator [Gammaproteobacteria bacterium]|jgi:transcriptional regulator with XRE-family HTH domain|nr:helix-turn-helix transcriptional regulator [Gammaproteobacteria bacterium]